MEEGFANDQISPKEYVDPFTGSKNKQKKQTAARELLFEKAMRCQISATTSSRRASMWPF
jgi:hypothetical protein